MAPQTLHVAFCLCNGVTLSDLMPAAEIFSGINDPANNASYNFKCDFLAPSMDPITGLAGLCTPTVNPTATYASKQPEGFQYDILFLPAGPPSDYMPELVPAMPSSLPSLIEFIKAQAPGCKYIMSVCGGSATLALAGVLSGKKATTNKAYFKIIQFATPKDVKWVAKARWVIDGNIWTSSGVTAGGDMALAIVEHLVGPEVARTIWGVFEVIENSQGDDPFAEFHGLV